MLIKDYLPDHLGHTSTAVFPSSCHPILPSTNVIEIIRVKKNPDSSFGIAKGKQTIKLVYLFITTR